MKTAAANVMTAWATIRFTTFGKMCRRMMCPRPLPMTRARSTNIRSRIESVCDRMIRAVVAHDVMPMTMTMTSERRPQPDDLGLDADDVEDDRREDDRQHERRKDQEEVRQAHQARCRVVPPTKPDDDADQRPHDDRDERRQQPDRHRDAGPVDGQVEHVAAELVGAEDVRGGRRLERGPGRRRHRLERPDEELRGDRDDAEDQQDRRTRRRRPPGGRTGRANARAFFEPQAPTLGAQVRGDRGRRRVVDVVVTSAPSGRGSRRRCRRRGWPPRP